MLHRRLDLNAQSFFIFFKSGKLHSHCIIARDQTGKVVLTFYVADALKFFVPQSFTAQSDDHSRQSSALLRNIGNYLAFNAAALREHGGCPDNCA